MRDILKSAAVNVVVFMADAADVQAGKTGLTLTVQASKDGGSFSTITPTKTELTLGWYKLALTATHTNTNGELALIVTGTGAVQQNMVYLVHEFDFNTQDNLISTIQAQTAPSAIAGAVWDAVRTSYVDDNSFGLLLGSGLILDSGSVSSSTDSTNTVLATGSAENDYYNNAIFVLTSGTGAGQSRLISNYIASTKTVTTTDAWETDPDATTEWAIIPGEAHVDQSTIPTKVWAALRSANTVAGSFGEGVASVQGDLTGNVDGSIGSLTTAALGTIEDIIWDADVGDHGDANSMGLSQSSTEAIAAAVLVDTAELQTDDVPGLIAGLNDPTALAIADAVLDESLGAHTSPGTLGKALGDVETDVTAILADTNELQTDDVPGLIAALNDPDAATIADAVWDEVLTGGTHNIPTSAGRRVRELGGIIFNDGTATAGGNNSITLEAGASTTDDFYNRAKIILIAGTGAGQEAIITDFNGSTLVATVTPAWTTNPDATSEYQVLPAQVHATVRNGGYDNGSVYVDTVNGSAGTEKGVNGTSTHPSDNLTDAYAIATAESLSKFLIEPGSALTLPAGSQNKTFTGSGYTVALNGADIDNSEFNGAASISGTATAGSGNPPAFFLCGIGSVTLPPSNGFQCGFFGTFTMGSEGNFTFGGSSEVFNLSLTLDYGAGLNASQFFLTSWGGGCVEIQNAGAGTGTYSFEANGTGDLTVNANCSDTLEVILRGHWSKTNNSAVAQTQFNEEANLVYQLELVKGATFSTSTDSLEQIANSSAPSAAAIADAVWDEVQAGHVTAGTFGLYLDSEVSGAGGSGPTADQIADAVWDEDIVAAHTTLDSAGQILGSGTTAAAVADAVWDEDRTGHAIANSFGKALGDVESKVTPNLDVLVSSRADAASVAALGSDVTAAKVAAESADAHALFLHRIQSNRWRIDPVANTLTIFMADGSSPLHVFDLKDSAGVATTVNVFERDPQSGAV